MQLQDVLRVGIQQHPSQTPIDSNDRVREIRADLGNEFIRTAVRFMLRTTLIVNPIAGIGAFLGVLAGRYPAAFVINHIIGMIMIFTPAWFFTRRKQPVRALWAMLLAGTLSLFVQIVVAREPGILGFLVLVVTLPALVLPWKPIVTHMFVSTCVYSAIITLVPNLKGTPPDWWTTLFSVILITSIFIAFGYSIQRLFDQFAKKSVEQEEVAAEHARDLVVAERNKELAVEREIERERDRFTRDLHDRLGNAFTSIGVQAEVAVRALPNDMPVDISEARTALLNVQRLADTGVDRLRRTIRNLRDEAVLQCSLPELVKREVEELQQTGIQGALECPPSFPALPPDMVGELLRVVQEALTNVQRHARATMVTVYLDHQEDTSVSLIIEDNGQGCDPSAVTTGFGLKGIQERVAALGGTFHPWTAPDQGFQVIVEVPLCV